MTDLIVHPAERGLRGTVTVPSDKSIGHRALLLSALATGTSRVIGFSRGEDNLSTLTALRALGVRAEEIGASELRVTGVSLRGLRAATGPLECGNSGTTMRLLAGVLAGQRFASRLVGDASLSSRPMMRVMKPLRSRGATIDGNPHPERPSERTAPLAIGALRSSRRLDALEYDSPVSSAQVKSAVLLSGLDASGPTVFREPFASRDHTERMLRALGAPVEATTSSVTLDPTRWDGRLAPVDVEIPGDLSAAAFLLVAAQIVPSSRVTVTGVGVNPTRTGILEIARDMGAGVRVEPTGERGGEPVGTLHGVHTPLVATRAGAEQVARAIDEVCIACALAARAEGTTRVEGAAELRVKESDRLAMMARTLRAFGVACEETADGLVIEGTQDRLRSADVESGGDHRVAMTAAILALLADGPSHIRGVDCIATSFPSFVATLRAVGVRVETVAGRDGPAGGSLLTQELT
jgi:3-phosphoshikimate 1-carboxyvinyltransferase